MPSTNSRLTILSKAEKSALYDLPNFDIAQCFEYLLLTTKELELMKQGQQFSTRVYFILQLGFFKAKQFFFRFGWDEISDDVINFILEHHFTIHVFDKKNISKYEHYKQCRVIAKLFGYKFWQSRHQSLLQRESRAIIRREINPQFVVMELLSILNHKKIIRPRYTTLQDIITSILTSERKRLSSIINRSMDGWEKKALEQLLTKDGTLLGLAALKQDAKNFKARMMMTEREKLATLKPLYSIAQRLLPMLDISTRNVSFYSGMIHYYSIYELRERLTIGQTRLYLLCYVFQRYQQINDNLATAFCYHLKQFEDEASKKAKESFYQYQKKVQAEQLTLRRLAEFYGDESILDLTTFGEVRQKAFAILPKEKLRQQLENSRPITEMEFRWQAIDKLGHRFKNHLRPLAKALDFSSINKDSPWLNAKNQFKELFSTKKSLRQRSVSACPKGTIPKRLKSYLCRANTEDRLDETIYAERYEFWIYRQLKKRLSMGELYLKDSIYHRSLKQELISLEHKKSALKKLKIPALQKPIHQQLDEKFKELHELWLDINRNLRLGKLKQLYYDQTKDTLHLKKCTILTNEEIQKRFYAQLPLCDITDIIRFVNEQCCFLSCFSHRKTSHLKEDINKNSLTAAIIAQAMNHSNLKMSKTSNISYDQLKEAYQARIRLTTLKAANNAISESISKMPIFSTYSLDLLLLYGGVDGQKLNVKTPTIKARYSKKYFDKGKGVVAYTMLANHIPLQVELIGPNDHESYYVFDIWYNNTSDISPDIVTGDMHCVNKANFAIMHWFGAQLFPRFTHSEMQRKHLYSGYDISNYEKCLIKPISQINRQLIEEEWENLEQIIATLGLKEMTQHILIKKLCTYTQNNSTRKALFEFDKLIRSIHTLKYLSDPQIQRNTHHSQNRIESYHQLRAAIANAYGNKELAGKTDIAFAISNQCGRLIANAIIHYNSAILSKLYQKYEKTKNKRALRFLKKISPVAWQHIHFQGHLNFSNKSKPIDLDAIISQLNLDKDFL